MLENPPKEKKRKEKKREDSTTKRIDRCQRVSEGMYVTCTSAAVALPSSAASRASSIGSMRCDATTRPVEVGALHACIGLFSRDGAAVRARKAGTPPPCLGRSVRRP